MLSRAIFKNARLVNSTVLRNQRVFSKNTKDISLVNESPSSMGVQTNDTIP